MKLFLHPVPIACLLLAITGAVLSNYALIAVALIAGVGSVGLLSARRVQGERSSDPAEELSLEGRGLLRPVRRLETEIGEIVKTHPDSPTITVIGGEAVSEAARLVRQVASGLAARDQMKKSLRGRYQAEKEIGESRMRMEFAGAAEKASLQAAIDARTAELGHYVEVESHIRQIESGVHQAEAVLAEMKARLSMSLSQDQIALGSGDDLRESLARMRSLSDSYAEAESVVRGS